LLIRIGAISPHADHAATPSVAAPSGLATLLASAHRRPPQPAARPLPQPARA
jgi:hypothetical protein